MRRGKSDCMKKIEEEKRKRSKRKKNREIRKRKEAYLWRKVGDECKELFRQRTTRL